MSNYLKSSSRAMAVAACGLMLNSAEAALVVNNGDFAEPVQDQSAQIYLPVGATIPGWTVIGNSTQTGVDVHHVSAKLWNQTQFMDLTGSTREDPNSFGGVQSDSLATIAGHIYTVTFDAMNGSLVYSTRGAFNGNAFSVQATGGLRADYNLSAGQVANSLTYIFTAAGNDRLTFQDLTGFDSNAGWIDNVAIVDNAGISPVPEPTTVIAGALLLLPFGASAIRTLRKRQSA